MIYQDDNNLALVLAHNIRQYLQVNGLTLSLSAVAYEVLALQLIDSHRQAHYLATLANRNLSAKRLDPNDSLFDPIKAICVLKGDTTRLDDFDEACWLAFLLIYSDDSATNDWAFLRQLYGGAGLVKRLTWRTLNAHPQILADLLPKLANALAMQHPKPKFGHHRTYESLNQLPTVFASYLAFIHDNGGHRHLFNPTYLSVSHPSATAVNTSRVKSNSVVESANNANAQSNFARLYSLVRQNLYRFGRLSTFEFLCLLGNLGLADVAPDGCYIAEASGPKRGAKLLFGQLNNAQLDEHANALAQYLDIGYQEMEAALCHWQKSPMRYRRYKG